MREAMAAVDVDTVVETVLPGQNGSGDADGDQGGDDPVGALEAVPATLLAEVDAAVVDLIERAPRRRARNRRR